MDVKLISDRRTNIYEEAIKAITKKEIVLDLGSGSPCSGDLKKKGELVVYLPFLYPYHGGNEYKDYYRFTYDAILYMFRDFEKLRIQEGEGYVGTTMRFMVEFRFLQKYLSPITNYFDYIISKTLNKGKHKNKVIRHGHFKSTTGYMLHAIK